MDFEVIQELKVKGSAKIILLVMDGLGGLPLRPGGMTELEAAKTPNMDALAQQSACGLILPVAPGITPGSGPAHLALFGYDPTRYEIGRGVLEALGIGYDLKKEDVAARGNFCTVNEEGIITDRRAGRISTEKCAELCIRLRKIELPADILKKFPGLEVLIEPVKEHRFVLVFRGSTLTDGVHDTDPGIVGVRPLPARPAGPASAATADLVDAWIAQARSILSSEPRANMVTLRGIAKDPGLIPFQEIYGLNPAAVATYPMYRGVAKLAGMEVLKTGETIRDEIDTLKESWSRFDFFFLHVKKTDSYGEDGNFERKVQVIEEVDGLMPHILELKPDVLAITGDHSTPSLLRSHSWHPVPVLIHSPHAGAFGSPAFSEKECCRGYLGQFYAKDLMNLAMANALRFTKFGA
jgi:2,3-bisphosphoglycerate-independent phosphoglycerate mutase